MRGLPLGKPFGIPFELHWSWALIFLLMSWSLAVGLFPAAVPNLGASTYWLLGFVTATLFFASVLAHELGHALTAKKLGVRTKRIVLFFFGGVAELESNLRRGRDEVLVAIAGPLVSFALAALCWSLTGFGGEVGAVAVWLARINFILAVFNLLPGFPLDGGRILRGLVWARTNSLPRATQIAGFVGGIVAWGMIGFGLVEIVRGDVVGGVWLMLLAFFLQASAAAEAGSVMLQSVMGGMPNVRQLAQPDWPTVERDTRLSIVATLVSSTGRSTYPVVDDTRRFFGLVTLAHLGRVERERWPWMGAHDVALPRGLVPVLAPNDSAMTALERMNALRVNELPAVEGEQYLGMVSREQIFALMHLRASNTARVGQPQGGNVQGGGA